MSNERVNWIEQRLEVIQRTIKELSTKPNRNPCPQEIYQRVQFDLRVEQTSLYAEKLAISEYLQERHQNMSEKTGQTGDHSLEGK